MISKRRERLLGRLRERRGRVREGRVLVEGRRAVEEALSAGVTVDFALATEEALASEGVRELVSGFAQRGDRLTVVDPGTFDSLTDTDTPQGIALVVHEPAPRLEDLASGTGRIAVLDGLQDPGNAGTLLRTARAFGLDGSVTLEGTVDVWNPKAVRAAAGAGFHLPVVRARWEEVEPWLEAENLPLLVGAHPGRDVRSAEVGARWALAVGNEGRGPRRELLAASRETLAVPMPGGAESLNTAVAGAILLYELALGRDR